MSSALALEGFGFDEVELPVSAAQRGVESLLLQTRPKPSYVVQGAAIAIYFLALAGAVYYSAHPPQPAEEDAIELVMLPPPAVPDEPPPPPPAPPVAEEPPPPPPLAEEPAVAPIVPPPPAPKPQPKPKVVEQKPVPAHVAAPAVVPPNALASSYTSTAYARIMAAAAGLASRANHQSGRVGYHIVISPSGSLVSQSITSSGNPAIDALATQALTRASFPATGMTRNASLTGAIVFR
jgi:protein TonB